MQIEKGIQYSEVEGYDPALNTLDIYFSPVKNRQPKQTVVVFIHGGGWDGGDKACFSEPLERSMPGWFVQRGFVFVALNFRLAGNRFSSGATVSEMASDIAKALRWLNVNGRRYGGRPSGFVLLGYSSGAHLAALVATHEGFLRKYHLRSKDLLGVIALDVPHFDVPLAMRLLETEDTGIPDRAVRLATLYALFGADRLKQEKVSPASQLGPSLARTAFLLVSVELQLGQRQSLTKRMSEHFLAALRAQGIGAEHYHLAGLEHADLIRRWGGELATCVERFLDHLQAARDATTLP